MNRKFNTTINYILIILMSIGSIFVLTPLTLLLLIDKWSSWVDIEIKKYHDRIKNL